MKKKLAAILAIAMMGLTACTNEGTSVETTVAETTTVAEITVATEAITTTEATTTTVEVTTTVEETTVDTVAETAKAIYYDLPHNDGYVVPAATEEQKALSEKLAENMDDTKLNEFKGRAWSTEEINVNAYNPYFYGEAYDDFNSDGVNELVAIRGMDGPVAHAYYYEVWYTDGNEYKCLYDGSSAYISYTYIDDTMVIYDMEAVVMGAPVQYPTCYTVKNGEYIELTASEGKLAFDTTFGIGIEKDEAFYKVGCDGTQIYIKDNNTAEDELTAMLEDFYSNSVEYGNDKAGYISMLSDWKYTESENGEYTLVSADGTSKIEAMIMEGISTDLNSTAMVFCSTVVMNAETEGFDECTTTEIPTGYFAMMIDTDTDLGFRLYAAYPDETAGVIRAVKAECSSFTVENLMLLSSAFDTYHN